MNIYRSSIHLLCAWVFLFSVGLSPLTAVFAAEEEAKDEIPLAELRLFAEIFGRIKQDYVESVQDRELLDYAIKGMLSGLDPHSAYLDEEDYAELKVGTSGEFGGLGIEVGLEDGFVKVIAPIDDTPAEKAGIKAGDLIIKLDDQAIKGLTLDEAVKLMRGKPGTEVSLVIRREGEDKLLTFSLERDVIKVASVKSRELGEGFGYIRVSQFQSHTASDMLGAINDLKKAAGGDLQGLVLDLRNNPGGVLNAAVSISDAFLREGLIVYTEGRVKDSLLEFQATPDDVLDDKPLVVLVNGGSASASEIVAGALQDHKRAVILGQPTFGKGSVQTIIPVNSSVAVKLTTARYFTPNGRSIQAEGIEPDIIIKPMVLKAAKQGAKRMKEADLAHHLSNPVNGDRKQEAKPASAEEDLLETDFELNEALNLLKGMAILRTRKG